jgi:cellulose synthase/poly-beta-1,6-N-acetylglucosamine synthase-like glycosyltransferase
MQYRRSFLESGNHGDYGRGTLPARNQEPLVSTIIAAFNAAESLQETLTSVTRQTYRNLDIIVVDDGSTDDTVQGSAGISRRLSTTP